MLAALLPILGEVVGPVIKSIFPDKEAQAKAEAELNKALIENADKIEKAAANIVLVEAQGGSWLQRSWRPIAMMVFLGMVVSWWFGFTPERATPELMDHLFDLIKIGLGGYVVGRSAEKIVPHIMKAKEQ